MRRALREFGTVHEVLLAFFGMVRLGTSKTALELIRMEKMLRVKQALNRKYKKIFMTTHIPLDREPGKYIWIYWGQGESSAPQPVKKAISSVRATFGAEKVILLDDSTFTNYVDMPKFILEKKHKGIISEAHFSDLLRMELLIQRGGTWMDATTLIDKSILNNKTLLNVMNSKLFFFQNLRPGQMGNSIFLSSWFISAWTNSPSLIVTRNVLYHYWSHTNRLADYFLFHIIWHISLSYLPDEFDKMYKIPNSLPLLLLYSLNSTYDPKNVEMIFTRMPIQKITYKGYEQAEENTTFRNIFSE